MKLPFVSENELVVGLDIGSHAIKVCQLKRTSNGYAIVTLGSTVLQEGAVDDGTINEPEMVSKGSVVFALTNPVPEIEPDQALAAGAAYAADGTSVNNVLGFPGIFRGALAAGAGEISRGMKLAAAQAIAGLTKESELVPDALDPAVHLAVADAVELAAVDEGLARPERVPAGL